MNQKQFEIYSRSLVQLTRVLNEKLWFELRTSKRRTVRMAPYYESIIEFDVKTERFKVIGTDFSIDIPDSVFGDLEYYF